MKKASLCILMVFVFYTPSEAAYKIYLKNGSVIGGLEDYEKVDGEVKFYYMGGIVGIAEEDIIRIEEDGETIEMDTKPEMSIMPEMSVSESSRPPAPKVKQKVGAETVEALGQKLSRIEKRLQKIKDKEDEAEKLDKEYRRAKRRIEVLWQRGRKKALKDGKTAALWLSYLTPQERQWVQLNTLKKRKLSSDIAVLKEELKPLAEEKELLLRDKKAVEDKLRGQTTPF